VPRVAKLLREVEIRFSAIAHFSKCKSITLFKVINHTVILIDVMVASRRPLRL